MERTRETIMGALAALSSHQFATLSLTLKTSFYRRQYKLFLLLHSPRHFFSTLRLLQSLTLQQKTLLIARLLLSSLAQLTETWTGKISVRANLSSDELDVALLLSVLCEIFENSEERCTPSSDSDWFSMVVEHFTEKILSIVGFGEFGSAILSHYIDDSLKANRLVETFFGNKAIAPPSVVCGGGGDECVICREEMIKGDQVCELPCRHEFHNNCISPWLIRNKTCPSCRFRLYDDEVFADIERSWAVLVSENRRKFHEG